MSLSSPCSGGCPCCSKNRCISSNPAMTRSSRGERPPFFSGWAKPSSSARSSSRSRSLIATLILVADKGGCTLRHPLLPGICRADRGETSALLLEFDSPDSEVFGLLRRQVRAFGGDGCRHLLQAVFAHGLGKDGVGFAERIDPVDEVNVEVAHVHRKLTHAIDQGGVATRLNDEPLGLLRQIQRGDRVLPDSLLVFCIKLGISILDDLSHADLG